MQDKSLGSESDPTQPIERLKEAYEVSTLAALAVAMGAPEATVKGWSQRGSVPLDRLKQAALDRNCSLDWLAGLTDDRVARVQEEPKVYRVDSFGSISREINQSGSGLPLSREMERLRQDRPASELQAEESRAPRRFVSGDERGGPVTFMDQYVVIPRYTLDVNNPADPMGYAYAEGNLAFDARWLQRTLGHDADGLVTVEMPGNSMEPTFFADQPLLVDRTQRLIDSRGGVYALQRDREVFVRRVQRLLSGGLQIISDNPAFQAELVPAGETNIDVIGRVVWPKSR